MVTAAVTSVAEGWMIVTRSREIAAAGADVVGSNGGEDVVGDGLEVVEVDLAGEGVR